MLDSEPFDTGHDINNLTVLKYKDFVPNRKSYNIWTGRGKYEPLTSALQGANEWITANPDIELLNIETVVLPNIHEPKEEGSEDVELKHEASLSARWHQFFRVWYIERSSR